jgi:2-dehydro-3-deoxyphosphogluconate aldolase/(4S)-4-hydroxy-2-oxoglutarate aldolase
MKNSPVYELAHIGINLGAEERAKETAELLAALFSLEVRKGSKSYFAGKMFECIRIPFRGSNGHIALRVSDLEQALRDLAEKNIGVDIDETTEYNDAGQIVNVYLHKEIGGFAIHLMQK